MCVPVEVLLLLWVTCGHVLPPKRKEEQGQLRVVLGTSCEAESVLEVTVRKKCYLSSHAHVWQHIHMPYLMGYMACSDADHSV